MEDEPAKKSRSLFKHLDLRPVNKRARRIEKKSLRHAHRFVVTRFANLRSIRRHIVGWLLLLSMLIGLTSLQLSFGVMSTNTLKATTGGTYAEGTVGSITTLNPLFASTQAELSSSKLIFAGLLKYDDQGVLQPDLAESWAVNKEATQYSFMLRPHLKWHDGQPLDANDVVATVKAMQDPRVGALTQASWSGIKVKSVGERQVIFTLPGAYAPFTSAATFAILPRHILDTIAPERLRESTFSQNPVGSGPFRFAGLKSVDITGGKSVLQLEVSDNYWEGPARVNRFLLYTYSQPSDLLKGLTSHEINAASNIAPLERNKLKPTEFTTSRIPLNNGVYALFRTDSSFLKDVKVRRALAQGINLAEFRRQLEVKPLDSPVVNNQLALSGQVKQAGYDKSGAEKLLLEAGWQKNKKSGFLEKDGHPLELNLVTVDAGNYRQLAALLSRQWSSLGIKLTQQIVDPQQVQQSVLRPRAYDILVYELELGGDADSYAYWHSSQATGAGLNFANYSSAIADDALTTARIRSDMALRDAKYATFAKQWVSDVPALSLYQPTLNYTTAVGVTSLNPNSYLPTPSDRFSSVSTWTVQTKLTPQTP